MKIKSLAILSITLISNFALSMDKETFREWRHGRDEMPKELRKICEKVEKRDLYGTDTPTPCDEVRRFFMCSTGSIKTFLSGERSVNQLSG